MGVVNSEVLMRKGALLGAVGNTHSILVFLKTTVSMEVKPRIEVTL